MATQNPLLRLVREQREPARQGIKGRNYVPPKTIPHQTQLNRLGATFERTARALSGWTDNVQASIDPRTVVPERVVVFELQTDVSKFVATAARLGFEWLASELPDDASRQDRDEEDAEDEPAAQGAAPLKSKRLYLTMPSLEGLTSLMAQWNRFSRGQPPSKKEFEGLWELFEHMVAIRRWSVQDRIDPLLGAYVARALRENATTPVRVEIDLWYRATVSQRDQARETLLQLLEEVGGQLLDLVTIEEIRYQGVLASLPPDAARRLLTLDDGNRLGGLDEIMAIRPQSAFISPASGDGGPGGPIPVANVPSRPCVSAMLDGYPVTEHAALAGRVNVQEVDVSAAVVPVAARNHGTAIASMIVRGDLHKPGPAITRPLLSIPILVDGGGGVETTPRDRLPIGVVYRALTSLVSEVQRADSQLRNLVVINHSICDVFAPFTRRPSAWAMLLDYFSFRHHFLFVVSAGNISEGISLPEFNSVADIQAATPAERQLAFILAAEREKARRGILSPAESVNSLTVGALHADEDLGTAVAALDPFPLSALPNLASATGLGINEALKPDILENGGRIAAQCANLPTGGVVAHPASSQELGQLVAAPSRTGDLSYRARSSGTSNAAALATRNCNFIADALDDVYLGESTNWSRKPTRAALLKALLTHTASWGAAGNIFEGTYPPQLRTSAAAYHRRKTIARFLGYGRVDVSRALGGAHNRATLFAEDVIKVGRQHIFHVPLPASMVKNKELRSITVTLAWTGPVMPYADYRGARLNVLSLERNQDFWDGVKRGGKLLQPNHNISAKGTVTHIQMQGQTLGAAVGPNGLYFAVHATANHSDFDSAELPYALAITLEMAQAVQSKLFTEVQSALQARAATRTRVRP
ncbi:S8 family serine peptidase [Variovorax paradoxus]|uniref:S8 family serine peptidase n=1 Tax=Variovorax paradoxus TaxID=34073 RepID=UPI003ECD267A